MLSVLRTDCVSIPSSEKKWWLIDAKGLVLGRLASKVAMILRGKHKAEFTPNMDNGDFIVIINADKVALTGNKYHTKKTHWHTGYVGGLKTRHACDILKGKNPTKLIRDAVKGMLPKGPLGYHMINKMHLYAGETHEQEAQKPTKYDFAKENRKNLA